MDGALEAGRFRSHIVASRNQVADNVISGLISRVLFNRPCLLVLHRDLDAGNGRPRRICDTTENRSGVRLREHRALTGGKKKNRCPRTQSGHTPSSVWLPSGTLRPFIGLRQVPMLAARSYVRYFYYDPKPKSTG